MPTPTQQLKNIRLVVKGDTRKWLSKVKDLVDEGADINVLLNYKGDNIVSEYLLRGLEESSLCRLSKSLFDFGLVPNQKMFVDCVMRNAYEAADVVFEEAKRMHVPINVNTLTFYKLPVDSWVTLEIIKQNGKTQRVKYLISKGFVCTKKFSLDEILTLVEYRGAY